MTNRIDSIVMSDKVPEELKANHKGFLQWRHEMTSKKHPPIVQILIDGKDPDALDNAGNALPTNPQWCTWHVKRTLNITITSKQGL
ncbi:hypothetical protein FCM35_KLT05076 [Carex littledalei]|uniref:Uncharacterized protein n=1 Tax=Carex littledalei TaxID=544730 RepID=A0A833VK96_9POAL|nr:hypothetical protein FCM35_KLT05076 [Carex littledalei]